MILDACDMAQARTPPEFVAWVGRKCDELSATVEAKAFARSGALLVKKFYDEIFPLARFVAIEYAGRNDVWVQPNLGNDNFDACVTLENGGERQNVFIEVTYAKDGYDLSLRMEVLARDGYVCLTGPVTRSGRKGFTDRRVSVVPFAANHLKALENYFALVEERLRAKTKVQYGKSHILIVAVDDYLVGSEDSDGPQFTAFAAALLPKLLLDFSRVVFVGVAGRLFHSMNRENGAIV